MSRFLLIGVACWLIVSDTNAAETLTSPVGQQITELQLNDHLGAVRKLSDWSDQKAMVVVFLGTECPLVKLYGPRLEQISRKYADQNASSWTPAFCLSVTPERESILLRSLS